MLTDWQNVIDKSKEYKIIKLDDNVKEKLVEINSF